MNNKETVTVGVIGFGTVGTGVVEFLLEREKERGDLRLARVAVANPSKPREIEFPHVTGDAGEVLDDPQIQVVVELAGGEQPALDYILRALSSGKSVVTANKAVVSRHMRQLFNTARSHGVDLAFEASVAGSIPIIRVLRGFAGERIRRVTGILNGTSNYILTRMEEGLTFERALELAQEKGFAEAAHQLDTGGFDARDKIAIVAALAFDRWVDPESIYCEGITAITPIDLDFAAKHGIEDGGGGYAVRSLATARLEEDGRGVQVHVYPALVPREHPLSAVRDEMNAVYLEGERCGPQLFLGRGAGRLATTSAVVADLLRVAGNRREGIVDELPTLASEVGISPIEDLERPGYVRMNLKHVPGSIAEASRIMGDHGLNIEDSMQRRRFRVNVDGETFIPDIVTLEPLPFGVIGKALDALRGSNRVAGDPVYLRFEE